jgi:hypothetical protein
MLRRCLWVIAFVPLFACAGQAGSEAPDLPPKSVFEVPGAAPATPGTIGKNWTSAQRQLKIDLDNRLADRLCDVVDDVLKPYVMSHRAFVVAEWSMEFRLWFSPAGRATRVTFDGTSTRQDLDQLLLSAMRSVDIKKEIPSWLPMPVQTRLGASRKNVIGSCRLKHLRSK